MTGSTVPMKRKKMNLNKGYWTSRYLNKRTGWDLGKISPPIKAYIDQLTNRESRILVPGAGNSYEAEYLFLNGFKNVYVLDIAGEPLINLKNRVPAFPQKQLLQEDFFSHSGSYNLILEQTFFCALPREKRNSYAQKIVELLKPAGKVAGVLFDIDFPQEGPPFGGSKTEYLRYFQRDFTIEVLEPCRNSYKPRQGTELFFIFKKN